MVLPVHDLNPTRRTPWVTRLLLAVNVVAFLVSPVATAGLTGNEAPQALCEQLAFFDEYAAKPSELLTNDPADLVATGEVGEDASGRLGCALAPPAYEKSPVLSVVTAMFLHGGWLHLAGNLLFLYVFGNNVEDRLGRLRFLLFYLACGFAATYGFALPDAGSTQPLVGASGAIAGVLGAYLVLFPRARVWSLLTFFFFLPVRLPAWVVLGSWFVVQYLYAQGAGLTEATGVAYSAHVIGFVVGAALVWRLRGSGRVRHPHDPRWGPYAPGHARYRPWPG
ncbi:MAG TPA: rhomboid family intramembrane serine protease [Mycobacteriales bacterium]|nr:rhomboid family intramembrane serine protease [Mycobacteriales bacterium]